MDINNIDFSHALVIYNKVNSNEYGYYGVALANREADGYRIVLINKPGLLYDLLPYSEEIIVFPTSGKTTNIEDNSEFVFTSISKSVFLGDSTGDDINRRMDLLINQNNNTFLSRFLDKVFIKKYKNFENPLKIQDSSDFRKRSILSQYSGGLFISGIPKRKPEMDMQPGSNQDSFLEFEPELESSKQIDVNKIIEDMKRKFIAQEEAVESIVSNIYINQRLIDTKDKDLISTSKAAILLDGPTGTGKTAIIKEVGEKLELPVVITKSTDYSTTGYVGDSLTDILVRLYEKADENLELAQRGIVCMDEFDKLGGEDKSRGLVMKRAVQQDLLTFIGGAKYKIQIGHSIFGGKSVEFDTTNLTFIGMGAYTDLLENKKKKNKETTIGFSTDTSEIEDNTYVISPQDYVDYGIERELVGRLHLKTHTNAYMKEDFKKIMLESEISPLKMFIKTVQALGIENVKYDDDFIDKISELAYEMGFGVRGLQAIFADIKNYFIRDLINETSKDIHLTMEVLEKIKSKNVRKF